MLECIAAVLIPILVAFGVVMFTLTPSKEQTIEDIIKDLKGKK